MCVGMSEYVGEGQFTRVYRGAFAQPLPRELLTAAPEPALALKHVKTRLAHKEREYIIGEVRASNAKRSFTCTLYPHKPKHSSHTLNLELGNRCVFTKHYDEYIIYNSRVLEL